MGSGSALGIRESGVIKLILARPLRRKDASLASNAGEAGPTVELSAAGTEIPLTLNGIEIDYGRNRYWKTTIGSSLARVEGYLRCNYFFRRFRL